MQLLVLPGDGIGPEITAATLDVLRAADSRFDLGLAISEDIVGHASLKRHGTTLDERVFEAACQADGLVLGPLSTFDFKQVGAINPSAYFRKHLDLYANIRPARTYEGVPAKLGAFDLVVVRENTEGFYADRNMEQGNAEILVTPDVSIAIRRITRLCCARIARAAFELATRRRKHVSIVHKANVLKIGDGMFIEECRKAAADYPGVAVDDFIVDAMMAHMVRAPQRFDVVITTNMFGDILSDLTSELSGSIGLGGSLNAGDRYAMAQAAHGSAPDIAGQDRANPFSLILSAALLLDWHGRRKHDAKLVDAAATIERGVAAAVAAHACTRDIGGTLGTRATGLALAKTLAAG